MLPCYRGLTSCWVDVRSDLISFMNFCHMLPYLELTSVSVEALRSICTSSSGWCKKSTTQHINLVSPTFDIFSYAPCILCGMANATTPCELKHRGCKSRSLSGVEQIRLVTPTFGIINFTSSLIDECKGLKPVSCHSLSLFSKFKAENGQSLPPW